MDHAVILATGDSNHKSKLLHQRVHAMLPALGKPIIARAMDQLYSAGLRRFTIVVGESDGAVASHLMRHRKSDVQISFMTTTDVYSLPRTLEKLNDKVAAPFVLTKYNCFIQKEKLRSLIQASKRAPESLILLVAQATLSRSENKRSMQIAAEDTTSSEREFAGQDKFSEYPHFSDTVICSESFLNTVVRSRFDHGGKVRFQSLLSLVQDYISRGGAFETAAAAWSLQVQVDSDLLELNRRLLDDRLDSHILSEIPQTVKIVPPVRIDPAVSIGSRATIGPYVYVETGATIGVGARVSNTIALANSSVPAHDIVQDTIYTNRGPII